jgi:phosphomevalonate kinase
MFISSVLTNLNKVETRKRIPTVLAFTGPRRSGKSLCASIVKDLKPNFIEKSFADYLREEFSFRNSIPIEALTSPSKKEEYRESIKDLSWELKRKFGNFFFAEKLFNNITKNNFYVIPDLRFIEELQLLCEFGGVAYRVYCPDDKRAKQGYKFTPGIDDEMAETDIALCSGYTLYECTGGGVIYNTKDEDYLRQQLSKVVHRQFDFEPNSKIYIDLEKSYSLEF